LPEGGPEVSTQPVTAVLIVHHEDEPRRAARAVVGETPGFESVGAAGSAEEALELAMALRADLVLVAAAMPGIDGRETSRRLTEARPGIEVVVFDDMNALTPAALQALWRERPTE
jgi:DNA-binding NarL/FixJ family response regulator